MTSVRIIFPDVKPHPGDLSLLPAFIWETIQAASLKIRSGLVMAGPCQGVNCLNPLWARFVRSALCSDKCFLCFPEKSDLPKRLSPLFLFLLVSPQTTEFGKKKKIPTCQVLPLPLNSFSAAITLGTGSHFEEGVDLPSFLSSLQQGFADLHQKS